jgi:transposase-like protein
MRPGCLSLVARRYGIASNQLFNWHRLYAGSALSAVAIAPVSLTRNSETPHACVAVKRVRIIDPRALCGLAENGYSVVLSRNFGAPLLQMSQS